MAAKFSMHTMECVGKNQRSLPKMEPLPSPSLRFYKGVQRAGDEFEEDEQYLPSPVYAQLTGFYVDGDGPGNFRTSYISHNWKPTTLMKQFFAEEEMKLNTSTNDDKKRGYVDNHVDNAPLSTQRVKMDESKALRVIKRFLKRTILRRRALSRLRALWQLINKASKVGQPERPSLLSPTGSETFKRPLAEMENDDASVESETFIKISAHRSEKVDKRMGIYSPRSVGCVSLSQIPRSILPKMGSVDRDVVEYSDVQAAELGPNGEIVQDSPFEFPCCSELEELESIIVNIICHEKESEYIPWGELELPNFDLSSFLSATSSSSFSSDRGSDWRPFDNPEINPEDINHREEDKFNEDGTREGRRNNEIQFSEFKNMIDLI